MLVTDEVGGTNLECPPSFWIAVPHPCRGVGGWGVGSSLECLPSFWIAMLYRKLHQRSATSVYVFGAALERAGRLLYMNVYRRLSCNYS